MIPCCLLLLIDNWNCKVEEVVTYLNSVNKGNKTDVIKCILFYLVQEMWRSL
jgi:hypothetical protein